MHKARTNSIHSNLRALCFSQTLIKMQSGSPADRVRHTAAVREESSNRGLDQEYAAVGVGVEMWTSCAEQEDVGFDEEVPGVVPVCLGEGVDVSEWGDLGISLRQ
jgi:hypothetical protein